MDTQLARLIDNFARLNVLVLGEAMLDVYLRGAVDRISREAPVPIVAVSGRDDVPGGAANTAVNVASLGAHVTLLSVVGDDREGLTLRESLRMRGVDTGEILPISGRQTLTKERVTASTHMFVRIDQGTIEDISEQTETALLERLDDCYRQADAVIVSDYCYGIVTPRVLERLTALQRESPRLLIVDSKHPTKFRDVGAIAVKPNHDEVAEVLALASGAAHSIDTLMAAGPDVLERTGAQIAAVTLDSAGALVFERGMPPYRTYADRTRDTRVSGAGDTFTAALALALASGAETPAAADIASAASSIVVSKDGTSTCTSDELREYILGHGKYVDDLRRLVDRVRSYREQGKRIVFTNGCFDIIHRGHVTYLSHAKMLGDVLIVAVNSDDSVRRMKGPQRPIVALDDRMQVLAAMSCVDHVVAFEEDTPSALIDGLKPDVFVKGGDYTRETLPEASLVESFGGCIEFLPFVEDRSTSGIIERIRTAYAHTGGGP